MLSIATALRWRPQVQNACDVDSRRFEEIYRRHFSFAWRTLRAMGVPESQVDDAVQEVFIIVFRRLATYREEASFSAWLFGIIRRVASDHRRSLKRKGHHVPIEEETIASRKKDVQTEISNKEALAIVEEFTQTLDEERRAIFVLAVLEEMSVVDVSKAIGLNANTVYSRLRVLKSSMKSFVKKRLGETSGEGND